MKIENLKKKRNFNYIYDILKYFFEQLSRSSDVSVF